MKNIGCFQTKSIQPLTAPTDFCVSDGGTPNVAFELTLNVDCNDPKDRVRMGGWKKLLSDTPFGYQNQDLHDQLIGCQFYHASSEVTREGYTAVTGYDYPYFFPAVDEPDVFTVRLNDLFAGSVYPELLNTSWSSSVGYLSYGQFLYSGGNNEYHMDDLVIGWPTNVIQLTLEQAQALEDGQAAYVGGQYYLYDYFYGIYVEQDFGESTAGYGYGTPVPVVTQFRETTYTNCSDELYYQVGCREPITLIKQVETNNGTRKLIAGTKSRVYCNDARGGNWRIILDRLGGHYGEHNCACHPTRWKSAQLGNIVVFTNNLDPVMAWDVNDGPDGCSMWSGDYILDLLSLDIETARCVAAWGGFVFLGNIVENGERAESKLLWSDYNNARSWAPVSDSVAGYHEFGRGESIIEVEPIGGRIRVYTNQAIYDGTFVGGDIVFHFREIYRGPDVIAFPNSLINAGDAHYYLGEDSIWKTEEQGGPPERVEWLRLATCAIFGGVSQERLIGFPYMDSFGPVNQEACEQVVGGYDSERKTLWFSWPVDDDDCATKSLIMNLRYGTSSIVDHGFTAFCDYEPDFRPSIRDWIAENGFCLASSLLEDKEGQPYNQNFDFDPPAYLFNEDEDPDQPPHEDSVHNALCDTFLEDICREQCGDQRFVMASASDYCLKEFRPDIYYREMLIDYGWQYDCGEHVPGLYELDGYTSMIQGRMDKFGVEDEKLISQAKISYSTEDQTVPGTLYMQASYAAQPGCRRWSTPRENTIECQTALTAVEHDAAGSRASDNSIYSFYNAGVYIGWRFYVLGTGSPITFNGLHLKVRRKQGKW